MPTHCDGLDAGDWPEADCGNHTPHPPHDQEPNQFWCWTDGEPSTFRCRERGHDVRESSPAGLIPRAALTDSQQDPAHVESQLRDAERERLQALAERDQLRELCSLLVAEVNRLSADLASARANQEDEAAPPRVTRKTFRIVP